MPPTTSSLISVGKLSPASVRTRGLAGRNAPPELRPITNNLRDAVQEAIERLQDERNNTPSHGHRLVQEGRSGQRPPSERVEPRRGIDRDAHREA